MTDQSDRNGERLAIVEVEVKSVKSELHEHKLETREQFIIINNKLDDLIKLKYKLVGVLLAASIITSGIWGVVVAFLNLL